MWAYLCEDETMKSDASYSFLYFFGLALLIETLTSYCSLALW